MTDADMAFPFVAQHMLAEIWRALDGDVAAISSMRWIGHGDLPSVFATSDLAQASVASAGLAVADWIRTRSGEMPAVECDRRLASMWFSSSLRAQGWTPPALWDSVAGDYRTTDGWIRLHTNASHHRAAALQVLGLTPDAEREAVAAHVARWKGGELEAAIVTNKGCAAEMRSQAQWADHPQGRAVAAEPLIKHTAYAAGWSRKAAAFDVARPLAGIRVLDLTRVLAGPTATRLLAGFGAEVLRIDPASWDEPGVVPEMTLGKRCAHLDLRQSEGRSRFEALLAQADVVVHGYRPQALEGLGLGEARRRDIAPGLIDVALDAYGWSGPWSGRRGFDSLVQMSAGIADAGMRRSGKDKPTPLPVQALDHATGYLMAASAIRGLTQREQRGEGAAYRLSLARTAQLLVAYPVVANGPALTPESAEDINKADEQTAWGLAHRLHGPLHIAGSPMRWDWPASPLRSSEARWR